MHHPQNAADIVVIGGGPAGMAAAIAAARELQKSGQKGRVLLLEQGPRVGKKLLSTGNGRCNLTNRSISAKNYHGSGAVAAGRLAQRFDARYIENFFASLGLMCRTESEGRVYPYCGQASAVLDALRLELDRLGVECRTGCRVSGLQTKRGGFFVTTSEPPLFCRRLIVAAGGRAAPSSGSDGSLFPLLKKLGHSCTPLFPALGPVKTDPNLTRPLKGLRCVGQVSFIAGKRAVRWESGEIQFGDQGLSGICLFQLSRLAGEFITQKTAGGAPCPQAAVSLDLAPEYTSMQLTAVLQRQARIRGALPCGELFTGFLAKRIGQTLCKLAGLPLTRPCQQLAEGDIVRLAGLVKDWRFPITGVCSFDNAQVTAGGLPAAEFCFETLASRRVPHLYAAGEVLDVDGDCGGYNLHWAWISGLLAGQSAAQSLFSHQTSKEERYDSRV